MSDLFFLGSGFSKAVHNSMPDLSELSDIVAEECKIRGIWQGWLYDIGDNIELWLTFLSQPQPWLKEYRNLENKALFLQITEIIRHVLDNKIQTVCVDDCPDWLSRLVKYWHDNKINVITLNYDTLIERAARFENIRTDNIYPMSLVDVRRAGAFIVADRQDSFQLFKLHGSVNWYYSGAASFYGEVLYHSPVAWWSSLKNDDIKHNLIEAEAKEAAKDKVPLIVPPTSEKSTYFQHETLRHVWFKASEALQDADCVYCIGYSLPVTDLGIRFFLLNNRPANKKRLYIVNKDETLAVHYLNLLGELYDIDKRYLNVGAADFVKNYLPQ